MTNFDRALAFTLLKEGGWNKSDPSMHGILQSVYDRWNKDHGLPSYPVKAISDQEVHDIYLAEYWTATGCDKLDWPLCAVHFDTSVNPGPGRSRFFLSQTHDVHAYLDLRRAYYRDLAVRHPKPYADYVNGWIARCDALEIMANSAPVPVPTPTDPIEEGV